MSQPTPQYVPGEQQPQQGYYASRQAHLQYEGQSQPHPPAAGYGQPQAVPGQPDRTQPQYGQPHHPPQAGYPQPDSGQTRAMPQMAYPSRPYFPQQPVPPARSRNRLRIGLLGGAVALVLVCGGVGYFVSRSTTNKPATPLVQVSTTPTRTAEAFAQTPPAPPTYSNTLEMGGFRLQVEISPARTGDNVVHMFGFIPSGQPQKVEEWKVTASLPAAGIDQVNVAVLQITDNHAVGQISLPAPGRWQFQFTLRTSEIHQDSVNAEVSIK